jgi:hypothetical protein
VRGTVRARWAVAVAGGVAVTALLAWALWSGGGGGRGTGYPPGLAPSAPAASAPAPSGSGGPAATGRPGVTGGTAPADQAATGFLSELGAIDPGLVSEPDRALAGGRATCQDLAAHRPDDVVLAAVVQRFRTGGVPVDRTRAALIVDAARNHLCP